MKTTIEKIRRPSLYLFALSLTFGATSVALADTFTAIDFPGATATFAIGINPRGDIVGNYTVAGHTHGFVLSGDSFTTIDFPGAAFTQATGIDPRGDIVGYYRLAHTTDCVATGPDCHAYLLSGGEFTTIDFPGATASLASGINPRGDIVGTQT